MKEKENIESSKCVESIQRKDAARSGSGDGDRNTGSGQWAGGGREERSEVGWETNSFTPSRSNYLKLREEQA